MARRKPKRRPNRVRRHLNWAPVLWLGFVVSTVLGVLYSPLTVLRKVIVMDVPSFDEARIQGIVRNYEGMAFASVPGTKIESDALKMSIIKEAKFSHNPFGSGRLELAYRTPVARLEGANKTALDEDGVPFTSEDLPESLPVVRVQEQDLRTGLALSTTVSYPDLVRLVKEAQTLGLEGPWVVEVREDRSLCLNTVQGTAIFGTSDRLEAKVEALRRLLTQNPNLFADSGPINVMSPEHPTGRKRGSE